MSAAAPKKAETGTAQLAAARHFAQMAKLFASRKAKDPPYLASATLIALKKAPREELAAVDATLKKILTQLKRVMVPEMSDENAKEDGK